MKTVLGRLAFILIVVFFSAPAQSQVTFNLTPSEETGFPGTQLTVLGKITNNSASTISLLGGSGTIVLSNGMTTDLSWDDLDFLNNLPETLASKGSFEHNLFINVNSDATLDTYTATYSLQVGDESGSNPFTVSDNMSVNVVSRVPAPDSLPILLGGMSGLFILCRRRRVIQSS